MIISISTEPCGKIRMSVRIISWSCSICLHFSWLSELTEGNVWRMNSIGVFWAALLLCSHGSMCVWESWHVPLCACTQNVALRLLCDQQSLSLRELTIYSLTEMHQGLWLAQIKSPTSHLEAINCSVHVWMCEYMWGKGWLWVNATIP